MRRAGRFASAVAIATALAVALPAGAHAAKRVPTIAQLVVFRDGSALTKRVAARQASVRVGGRRCAAGTATALAALVRSKPGSLSLRDYGSCSKRPRDGAGLFVRAIRGERNRGQDGWVYKVGQRAASAGAADPTGPFGNGRLKRGARVTWLYCDQGEGGCQRTLAVRGTPIPGGLRVQVSGYDDRGRGVPVAGASVHVGSATATTEADGGVDVPLALPSSVRVYAEKTGLVRSFSERMTVR